MKNLIMNNKANLIAAAMLVSLSGCASVAMDSTQKLTVATALNGKPVPAECSLKNDKNVWAVSTPGTVDVARSAADLLISCASGDGTFSGASTVESHANSGMYGNILVGGLLGAAMDHHSGKGFDYPDNVTVKMGEQKGASIGLGTAPIAAQ